MRAFSCASLLATLLSIASVISIAGCTPPPQGSADAERREDDSSGDDEPVKPRLPLNPEEVAPARAANGDFAIDLYRVLAGQHEGKNVFFSPLSISTALAIASEGAVGETANEMGNVLRFPAAAANTAGDSADRPWNTELINRGQAAITSHLIPPALPKAQRQRIAQLRKDLATANTAAQTAERADKYQEAQSMVTKAEKIAEELNAILKTVDQYELRIGNALWAEKSYPLRPAYVEAIKKFYGGDKLLIPVDFRDNFETVRRHINAHVEQQTANRIKDLLPQGTLDSLTKLVITNAVYFKGEWHDPFKPSSTQDQDFTLADGKKQPTPTMSQRNYESARYGAFNGDGSVFDTPRDVPIDSQDTDPTFYPDASGFTAVEIAYKGKELAMVFLVPQSESGLGKLEELLTHNRLQSWIGTLQSRTVENYIPRFKLETNYGLVRPLQTLGMKRAFIDPALSGGAQFDGMTVGNDPRDRLYISDVLHKTYVEVNEKGTEAAAATAVVAVATAAEPGDYEAPKTRPFTPIFRANKPFLFLIRDKATNSLVFLGRFMTPAADRGL